MVSSRMPRRWVSAFLALSVVVIMSCVGWATCTTGWVAPSDNDSHGGMSWDNGAGGETAYDDDWASTTVNGDEHEYDNFAFTLGGNLPAMAVITGFDVRIRGYSVGGGSVSVALSHDGGSTIDLQGGTMPWVISLPDGASNVAWNSASIDNPPFIHTFLASEVCGGNDTFTVWVKANVAGTAVYVDAVEVRVTYYDESIYPWTPNNPTPSSSTHSTGVWYNASTLPDAMVTLDWTSATDRPTCDSGIDGYRIYWDTSSSTSLGASDGYYVDESGAHTQDFAQGSGSYWFHIRSVDNVGYLADSTAHLGPFRYDDSWPTNPNVTSTRSTGTWINSADVPISVSGASDSPAGVDGFAVAWTHAGTWTPDNTKDREETWTGETFAMSADGVWYFHLSTVDNAGNWTASSVYETEGWFGVDTHVPTDPTVTSPTHTEGARSSNSNVQISVSGASDPTYGESGYEASSGVDGFSVVWDHSPTGVPDATKDQEESWTGTTTTLADGTWYFHLRTKDNAGNWTSTEDYGPIILDTDPPGVSAVTPNLSQITDANVGAGTFTLTVDFDEAMDTGVNPTLTLNPTVSSTLTVSGSSWIDSDSYRVTYNVADANVDVNSVTVDVTGAQDLTGLPQEDYAPVHEFDVDTLNPTVTAVGTSDALITDADAGGTFTVTVDFSEAMTTDGTADPTLTFAPAVASTLSFSSESWTDSDTYTATYSVSDANVDVNNVTIDVTLAEDVAGNGQQNYVPQNEFGIDTVNPTVSGVAASDALISDDDTPGNATFLVTIDFSEAMNTGVAPTVSFNPSVATTLTLDGTSGWSDSNTYVARYDVADANVDVDDVSVDVSGAQDAGGNPQQDYTPQNEFGIDTVNPTVSDVVASDALITDADTPGNGTFVVTIDFSESMNTSVAPTVSFDPTVATTLSLDGTSGWLDANTYEAKYDVADGNVDVNDVEVDVTGARDAAGNLQQNYTPESEFGIDTLNPSVVSVATNDALITDADTPGTATFVVTVVFDEPMNTGVVPTISFDPTVGSTLSINAPTGWDDSYTFLAYYDVADFNVDVNDVTIDVTGAEDVSGNPQQDYTPEDEFGIDTLNPTVTGVAVDDTLLSDSDAGTQLIVTIDFSEPMDTSPFSEPMITLAPSVTTTLTYDSGSWTTNTRFRVLYDISDANVDVDSVTIDVSSAADENGNPQQDYTPLHEFEIDTLNPTVTQLTLSDHYITDADVGGTFVVTIDYSEPMLTTVPSIVFSPSLDTTLSFQAGSSGWSDTDTYVARYTILDGNVTVMDDDIIVTQAQDLAGNVQVTYNYDDQLDVDTENPYIHDYSVTGGEVDDGCLRVVTFTAKVTDPNGTMQPGDVTVTSATVTNATIGAVYDVIQTSDNQTTITVTGKVDVTALTACPARVTIVLDAVDSVDNDATQQSQSDDVIDTTLPVIYDLRFDTDASHAAEQTVPYLVDACGLVTVYFSANATDNCCISTDNVDVEVTLPTGNAILEDIDIDYAQTLQGRVDITGSAVVRCLDGPEVARVQVDIEAVDCCGNAAVPESTETDEGLVDDTTLPIPRDDPRQDMPMDESAVTDPLVEVRMDDFGTYRLVLRESTPVRIGVMANDADNLTHNGGHPFEPCIECGLCGGQTGCCATMFVEEIVKEPDHGSVLIEDDTGDCNGGTVIRYAPDRGYLGADSFTYRIRDAFGNVSSEIATVYLQVVPEVWMDDVFVTVCAGETVEFSVRAEDLFVDPDDPDIVPFTFSIVSGPEYGVVGGSVTNVGYAPPSEVTDPQFGILVPSLDVAESATLTLTYTAPEGMEGRDQIWVRFEDPFGGMTVAAVDILIDACGAPTGGVDFTLSFGDLLPLIVPATFDAVYEADPGSVMLTRAADGTHHSDAVLVTWNETINRYVLVVDTSALQAGRYELSIALGTGETVRLVLEVGEAE